MIISASNATCVIVTGNESHLMGLQCCFCWCRYLRNIRCKCPESNKLAGGGGNAAWASPRAARCSDDQSAEAIGATCPGCEPTTPHFADCEHRQNRGGHLSSVFHQSGLSTPNLQWCLDEICGFIHVFGVDLHRTKPFDSAALPRFETGERS